MSRGFFMEEVTIIGVDKFLTPNNDNILCKGIIFSKLGYKVNLFHSNKYEPLNEEKRKYLATLDNFTIYECDEKMDIEVVTAAIKRSKFVIINPMDYNYDIIAVAKELNENVYVDLANYHSTDYDFISIGKNTKGTMIISRNKHVLKTNMADQVSKLSDTVAIIFKSDGEITVYTREDKNYIKLFIDKNDDELYLYSSIFLAGFIYGYEIKPKDIFEASHYGTVICDLVTRDGIHALDSLTPHKLQKEVKIQFGY